MRLEKGGVTYPAVKKESDRHGQKIRTKNGIDGIKE